MKDELRLFAGALAFGFVILAIAYLVLILLPALWIRFAVALVLVGATLRVFGRIADRAEALRRGNRRRAQHGWRA